MPFKALNNREKDKAEYSYIIYSHITNHLNSAVKTKRSQSALEYMMTIPSSLKPYIVVGELTNTKPIAFIITYCGLLIGGFGNALPPE